MTSRPSRPPRRAPRIAASALTAVFASALAAFVAGCGGHEARTLKMRTALDQGRPRDAVAAIEKELDVGPGELPKDIEGDNALLVLDRASILQSLAEFAPSKRDFEAADKAIDMLDLARNAGDDIGKYIFSDDAGRYRAPPYEKLLINTLNIVNYLELNDLNGARIEARRLAVIHRYYKDQLKETDDAIVGLGGFLAGFAFEKSGSVDQALRFYDDALAAAGEGGYGSLRGSIAQLATQGSYTTPRIRAVVESAKPLPPLEETEQAEILLVAGYGRVPHKIAERVPIGLALTYVSGAIHPNDYAAANALAAQGLVTWVNFPTLAPGQGEYGAPTCTVNGHRVALDTAVDVAGEVRKEWKKVETAAIVSAITRMVTRAAVGAGTGAAVKAASDNGLLAILASLFVQGTLTALDTPDTRSWETLPARISVVRVRVAPGKHRVVLSGRGVERTKTLELGKGDWAVVSLMALR
jgi:hypothetical protein